MRTRDLSRYLTTFSVTGALLAGCGGGQPGLAPPAVTAQRNARVVRPATRSPIQHVIVVVQQHRSFDNLFAGFPGADAPTFGRTNTGQVVSLKSIRLEKAPCRLNVDSTSYFPVAYDGGKMDGWNLLDPTQPLCAYTRVERSEANAYWTLARRYAVADHMFASTHFGTFPQNIYLIAGTTKISQTTQVVGPPKGAIWGCDAPPGSRTSILKNGRLERFGGPFPCFDQFPTMANLFDQAGLSWKFYYDSPGQGGSDWNPFEAIKYVVKGQDWSHDMGTPATQILTDLANGNLASVAWVLSPPADSDGPGSSGGPRWVNAIVESVKNSQYWPNTAIVIIWNDEGSGQFYDDVPPPQLDRMGLGFRVPAIVVSPYAKHGYVSHTEYEFGSILKFIEETFGLPGLGGSATDARANSLGDMFTFASKRRL